MSLAAAISEFRKESAPKILTVDIETSPNVVYAWGLWDQNIGITQIIEPSRVLCFAAKWYGSARVEFHGEDAEAHEAVVRESWRLYDEADVVVTYNGPRFDNIHLAREWLLLGLGPPSPWVDIDLLAVARHRFKFVSNKLGYVTSALGLPTKLDTGGQALWNEVMKGDPKAWAKFRRYNVQDVKITEQLLDILWPWVKGPHLGQWTGSRSCCYSCGSPDLTLAGMVYGRTIAYPKMVCRCGAWNKVLRNGDTRAA